jgi:anti-sigma regulatory factor (Ser/Thr protein kinase)/ActR/RegA family two-component response regulator
MAAKRVIAVRPDPPLLQAIGRVLDPHTCALEPCAGSADALRRVREHPADVLITDPASPIDEDLALVAELANVRPALRTIVLTPSAAHAELVSAIRAQVFACFTAPLDRGEVADMVSTALGTQTWRDGIQVVSGTDHWLTFRVSCQLLTADRLVRFVTELNPTPGRADRDLLIAAFREMLLNAMEHGAGFDARKVIEVTAAKTARAIVYHFRDPGEGFDRTDLQHAARSTQPEAVLATALARAEMGLRPGGFGMLIARQVADELVYNERGNEVLLIKHLD